MSPLARSLLALAALLAAAHAQRQCDTKDIGDTNAVPVTLTEVNLSYPGEQVEVPDACGQRGMTQVGEEMLCCNETPNQQLAPPNITGPTYPNYTPFYVFCYDTEGCNCKITEYCSN